MKALSLTIQKLRPMQTFLWTKQCTDGQAKNYIPLIKAGGIKIKITPYQLTKLKTTICQKEKHLHKTR